jgi:hypothetical protein
VALGEGIGELRADFEVLQVLAIGQQVEDEDFHERPLWLIAVKEVREEPSSRYAAASATAASHKFDRAAGEAFDKRGDP